MTEREPAPHPVPQQPPSPPWYGAVVFGLLLVPSTWLFLYAFADLGWQQDLGGWNYLIALLVTIVPSQMLQRWRGDAPRTDGLVYGGRRRRAERRARKAAERDRPA